VIFLSNLILLIIYEYYDSLVFRSGRPEINHQLNSTYTAMQSTIDRIEKLCAFLQNPENREQIRNNTAASRDGKIVTGVISTATVIAIRQLKEATKELLGVTHMEIRGDRHDIFRIVYYSPDQRWFCNVTIDEKIHPETLSTLDFGQLFDYLLNFFLQPIFDSVLFPTYLIQRTTTRLTK
jgi:hypothetical protein